MKLHLIKRLIILATVSVATVGVFAGSASAYYDTSYCNGKWRYASTWGRGCVDDGIGVVQDTRSDTGCVEAKYRDNYGRWLRISNSTDCYGGGGTVFTVPKNPSTGSSYQNVRIYHGEGWYRTLSPL